MTLVHRLAELRAARGRGVLFTVVEGSGVGAKALVVEGGETIGDGVPEQALRQFHELVRRGRNRLAHRSLVATQGEAQDLGVALRVVALALAAVRVWSISSTTRRTPSSF